MAGGAGFIMDMVRRMRQNRELRKGRLNRNREKLNDLRKRKTSEQSFSKKRTFKTYSPEELAELRNQIRAENRSKSTKAWIATILIVVFIFWLLFLLFKFAL